MINLGSTCSTTAATGADQAAGKSSGPCRTQGGDDLVDISNWKKGYAEISGSGMAAINDTVRSTNDANFTVLADSEQRSYTESCAPAGRGFS